MSFPLQACGHYFFTVLKLMLLSSQPEPSLLVCLVLNSGHHTSLAIPLPLGLCYNDSSRNSLETHVPLPILTTEGILIIYNNLNIEKIMCSLWFFFRGLWVPYWICVHNRGSATEAITAYVCVGIQVTSNESSLLGAIWLLYNTYFKF